MSEFLPLATVADLAGVEVRALQKAVRRANADKGQTWRGVRLVVRELRGRGGRSGLSYEGLTDSLPDPLQVALKAYQTPVQLALKLDDPSAAEREWRHALIMPAIAHAPRSAERRAAVRAILAAEHIRDGRRVKVPGRTVLRWLADFDAAGLAGLNRKKRADAGEAAVLLTRRWDKAVAGVPEADRAALAEKLKRHVRSLWAGGASYAGVHRLASEQLAEWTYKAGCDLAPADLAAACNLPKHVVDAGRPSRRVHERRTNIKKWDDERLRVRLTSGHLEPMEIVYGDVHHFDVYVKRTDGTVATPKGIAWLDAANRRLRIDLVLCEAGTGIRNADLIQSFINMTQDPRWGRGRSTSTTVRNIASPSTWAIP